MFPRSAGFLGFQEEEEEEEENDIAEEEEEEEEDPTPPPPILTPIESKENDDEDPEEEDDVDEEDDEEENQFYTDQETSSEAKFHQDIPHPPPPSSAHHHHIPYDPMIHHPQPEVQRRPRGRPKMTEEQKEAARAKREEMKLLALEQGLPWPPPRRKRRTKAEIEAARAAEAANPQPKKRRGRQKKFVEEVYATASAAINNYDHVPPRNPPQSTMSAETYDSSSSNAPVTPFLPPIKIKLCTNCDTRHCSDVDCPIINPTLRIFDTELPEPTEFSRVYGEQTRTYALASLPKVSGYTKFNFLRNSCYFFLLKLAAKELVPSHLSRNT